MATRRCGEIEVGAVPHKQSQVKAVNTAEESRTLAGGFHPTQNGDKRGYDTSKEDAEKVRMLERSVPTAECIYRLTAAICISGSYIFL